MALCVRYNLENPKHYVLLSVSRFLLANHDLHQGGHIDLLSYGDPLSLKITYPRKATYYIQSPHLLS